MSRESFLIVIGIYYREMYMDTNEILYLHSYAEIRSKLLKLGIDLSNITI